MKFSQCISRKLVAFLAVLVLNSCGSSPQLAEEPAANTKTGAKTNAANFDVIAYYTGSPEVPEQETLKQLTHIIYSFAHLKGNKLAISSEKDSLALKKLIDLKEANPKLKVMVALGGWGGCESCSRVFSLLLAGRSLPGLPWHS